MRHFNSYGPVDPKYDYAVPRTQLVEQCVGQLVGIPEERGHYFTIWAPRQTGKTWLMRRAIAEIRARYGDRFLVGSISMQGTVLKKDDPPEALLSWIPGLFSSNMQMEVPRVSHWEDVKNLFIKGPSPFKKPLILLIDEFDKLSPATIDVLVGLFRDLHLNPEGTVLHGLALLGVRAVLGVESDRGSPFNVQRSMHVPNLTFEEVTEMFAQYQTESGQPVDPAVVQRLYEMTRGQPGLVGWFGELLTEKYNPTPKAPITLHEWDNTYDSACFVEPNNTVLNLLQKARDERYRSHVVDLFKYSNIPFGFDKEWCNYLYLNGILTYEEVRDRGGRPLRVCRFSSPFIQHRLYNAFADDMAALDVPVPAVDPQMDLTTILQALDLPALLQHYRDYLHRAKEAGHNPFRGHPTRVDLHLREAVGHFHLFWWLTQSCAGLYTITPEFPTGNGKVDLHIRYDDRTAVLEVKSFTTKAELPQQKQQAARYAQRQGLSGSTLALFVPTIDEALLASLTKEETFPINGHDILVTTVAISGQ